MNPKERTNELKIRQTTNIYLSKGTLAKIRYASEGETRYMYVRSCYTCMIFKYVCITQIRIRTHTRIFAMVFVESCYRTHIHTYNKL